MARIRSIHPDACKSDKLDRAGAEAERCYWRLQPHCDDEGRVEDDPRLLRSLLFPLSDKISAAKVDGWLGELQDLGLIVRYEANGERCLCVTRWADYQKPQKRMQSKLPPMPEDYATLTLPLPDEARTGMALEMEIGVGDGGGVGDARTAFADDFSQWWSHYPRKIDRGAALKAYQARRRSGDAADALLAAVRCYAAATAGTERQFIKHGATFLHGPCEEWANGPPAGWVGPALVPKNSLGLPEIIADIERRRNGTHTSSGDRGSHADHLAELLPGPSIEAAVGRGSDAP